MIALYSYLLTDKSIRDPNKKYLLIATVTEHKKFSQFKESQQSEQKQQQKLLKTIERKFTQLQARVDKQIKDVQDRLDQVSDAQQKVLSRTENLRRP
mmetsp:Transcript_21898/g.16223  ORF Transcript_21898/g.16223 Transcript_21898/m.16223 type:complete len:97 (-) Transcript_21898:35-325(-)